MITVREVFEFLNIYIYEFINLLLIQNFSYLKSYLKYHVSYLRHKSISYFEVSTIVRKTKCFIEMLLLCKKFVNVSIN